MNASDPPDRPERRRAEFEQVEAERGAILHQKGPEGSAEMRICIGHPMPGYTSRSDLLLADSAAWSQGAGVRCADEIFLNNVLATLTIPESERLLSNVARTLKLGGRIRIADIDGYDRNRQAAEHLRTVDVRQKPTVTNIAARLFKYGFQVLPLQYHDIAGNFHSRLFEQDRAPFPSAASPTLFPSLIVEGQLVFERRKHRMSPADALDVYRGILGHTSFPEHILKEAMAKHISTAPLCSELLSSPEFQETLLSPIAIQQLTSKQIAAAYEGFRVGTVLGSNGFVTGALGDRIDIKFADYLAKFDGTVASSLPLEGTGVPVNQPVEYFAVLSSVLSADVRGYVAVELGAGFGPWLVRAALAARQRGISNIRLAAVEADPVRFECIAKHLLNNDFEPDAHQLWCGAVGANDGIAYFPEIDPAVDWGASAVSVQKMQDLRTAGRSTDRRGQVYREVKCFSIATIIDSFDFVDLLHIDIQGQELEAVRGSIAAINNKIRWMFIGTHDFAIDAELIRCLAGEGWEAKHIRPRNVLRHQNGRHAGTADGEQLWINPRLA